MSESMKKAIKIFRRHGGVLQTGEAINKGIHPRTLYAMRDEGTIERLCRGTYRLADLPPLTNPHFATVAAKIPKGVICLISALSFHELCNFRFHKPFKILIRKPYKLRMGPCIKSYLFIFSK